MDEIFFGWRTALLLVVAAQLLIAAVLLGLRRFERPANRLLAALLVVVTLTLVPQLIGFAGFYDAFPWLSFAPFQNDLLVGPLILGYGIALTTGRIPAIVWWLMLPGAIDFSYQTYWFLQPFETRWDRVGDFHAGLYWPLRNGLAVMLALFGLAGAGRAYWQHRRFLGDHSSAAAEFDRRWLPLFLGLSALTLLSGVIMVVIDHFIVPLDHYDSFAFHVVVALCFWAIGQCALLLQREPFPKLGGSQPSAESVASGRDWVAEARRLRARVQAEAWHLEPRLTARELARRVGTNESYLSRTVNQGAGVNFNRFINEIRVAHVREKLAAGEGAHDMLALALDSGFNSKATFNRVFKDITGQTPARVRAGLAAP
ncbi:AraC family transcriptional regulator [Maricaulis sp.]|uniref:helix-turn-helix domain-containing protein n=1 Tax=Maricaulis sp. TaxID=1486257 RepID=UPI002B26F66C|nr:AraC family transcriptional regulator [Maricaulis sp.]